MQLTFESLAELRAMIAEMGYIHRSQLYAEGYAKLDETVESVMHEALARTDLVPHSDEGFTGPVGDALRELPVLIAGETANEPIEPPTVERREAAAPVKRKRRTKAEIEAEQAAAAAAQGNAAGSTAGATSSAPADPLANLQPQPGGDVDAARAEIAAQAPLFDGSDRLAHINEGRAFIEKHGFPAYNETMQLAGVPANITGHTVEQASMHRSAMAWVHARKTGEA